MGQVTSLVNRVAIVGLGSIGRRHLRLLREKRPEIHITVVRSGRGGGCPEEGLASSVVGSVEEAAEKGLDAAILASPAPLHASQARTLVKNNVPVLIEKPLSDSLSESVYLLSKEAEKSSALALIGYVFRYSRAATCFLEELNRGRAGKPLFARIDCGSYLPDWRPDQDYRLSSSANSELGGGVLLELSHEIDYGNWFFGPFQSVQSVLRNSGTLDIEVEDTADILLRTKDDLPVSIHLDFCRRKPGRSCTLYGSEGTLNWDALKNRVEFTPANGEYEFWQFQGERDDMFRAQLDHFFACIEQGKNPRVGIEDGIGALELVEAARQSHYQNKAVWL